MSQIKFRRFFQVVLYGLKEAKEISRFLEVNRFWWPIYIDIISCFCRYYVMWYQYKSSKLWSLSIEEKEIRALEIGEKNHYVDKWLVFYRQNWKFIARYSSIKWETNSLLYIHRRKAYQKQYKLLYPIDIQYGVKFISEHEVIGDLFVGKDCFFARDVDIDFTGGVHIGNNVKIAEAAKILTHNHDMDFTKSKNDALILSPINIEDYVSIGAKSVILPGTGSIGRGAMICAAAVVKKKVPPYAIVMGNPATIVGFRYSPDIIAEFETENYKESERISIDVLESNYKKYYLSRLKEIQTFFNTH